MKTTLPTQKTNIQATLFFALVVTLLLIVPCIIAVMNCNVINL